MRISDWSSRRVLFRSLGQFLRQADHRFGRSDRIFPAMTDQYLRLDGRNIGERWCIIDAMKTYAAPQICPRAGAIENAFAAEAKTTCGRPIRLEFSQCFQPPQRAMQETQPHSKERPVAGKRG